MDDFKSVNEIYSLYFVDVLPARSCVAVRTLPKNAKVEIECVAVISKEVNNKRKSNRILNNLK
jgi:2-iminobutanoate/2-iminopropanoate deaminase